MSDLGARLTFASHLHLGKWSESFSVMSDSLQPHGLYSPWNSPGQTTRVPSVDLPNPGIKPKSPSLQVDSLPAEPQGKPKNTGVGSVSFLQGIFLTQELNQGLQHCRQILYQLSYQWSPYSWGLHPNYPNYLPKAPLPSTITLGLGFNGGMHIGVIAHIMATSPIVSAVKLNHFGDCAT